MHSDPKIRDHETVISTWQTSSLGLSVKPDTVVLFSNDPDRADRIARMFVEYGAEIQGYIAKRIRSREDARDLTQEVFARFIRSRHADGCESPSALLYEIATNLIIDRSRRRKSHRVDQHRPYDDDETEGIGADPSCVLDSEKRLQQVEAIILGLPDKCREVFVLSRFEGLSYAEIALRLDISVAMVQKHISKALLRLRQGVARD